MPPLLLVELPLLPPTTNHLYIGTGKGRHRHPKYIEWEKIAFPAFRLARSEIGWEHTEGQLYQLILWLEFGDRRRTDASNRIKAAEDVLASALEFDDQHIVDPRALHCGVVPKKPRTLLALRAIESRPQWGVVGERNVLKTRQPYKTSLSS